MSRTLQFKRYANTAVANTTGANGELIIDATNKTLTIHNGVTPGGSRLATELYVTTSPQGLVASAAFNKANSANIIAQSAYNFANTVNVTAGLQLTNIAFYIGTVNDVSNSAFNTANAAYAAANLALIRPVSYERNSQNTNYTLVPTDVGNYIYFTNTSNVRLYIPQTTPNTNFSNGSTIIVISKTSNNSRITLTPNANVQLYYSPIHDLGSGQRNVMSFGVATLYHTEANTWFLTGSGLT
jgi:hypothetical protein